MKRLFGFLFLISLTGTAFGQAYLAAGFSLQNLEARGESDDKTIGMLTAGYRLRWFAAEAFCGGSADCGVGALGHLELAPRFSVLARVAAHHMKGSIDIPAGSGGRAAPGSTTSASSATWSGWAPAIGVGMQYTSQGGFGGRVLLEQTRGTGQLDRARIFSASLLYSF